jgi:hypothetical protein
LANKEAEKVEGESRETLVKRWVLRPLIGNLASQAQLLFLQSEVITFSNPQIFWGIKPKDQTNVNNLDVS